MSDSQNTEILRLVTQMIREIGDFRALVETQFSTLRQEMNERFDKIDARFIDLEYRMKYLAHDSLEVHAQLDRVDDLTRKLVDKAA